MADATANIKKLISYDQLGDAIDLVINTNRDISDNLYNKIIQISHRNRHNDSIFHQGIVDINNYKLEKNRICNDFLFLLDEIKEHNLHPKDKELIAPEIKLLGEAQQNRLKKIISELISTDKEIVIITRDINKNNEKITLLSSSSETIRLKKENKKLQQKLKKLEKQYELLKNEYNALKREKEHMKLLTRIFAKKDTDFEDISKQKRFLEFELEQAERNIRELKKSNVGITTNLNKSKVESEQLNNILKNLEEKTIENKFKNDSIKKELSLVNKDNESLRQTNTRFKYLALSLLILLIASIVYAQILIK